MKKTTVAAGEAADSVGRRRVGNGNSTQDGGGNAEVEEGSELAAHSGGARPEVSTLRFIGVWPWKQGSNSTTLSIGYTSSVDNSLLVGDTGKTVGDNDGLRSSLRLSCLKFGAI